jgi:anti-sigma factor RsiW
MEHRHLLPEEIDQLVDGESGFGIQPLRAHVRRCDACRAELAEAQALADALGELPHFAPRAAFADRVMAQVQVFEPWHVAAADTASRWLPKSRPVRGLLVAAAASFAAAGSLLTVWMLAHLDAVLFFGRMVLGDARAQVGSAVGSSVAGAVGEPALGALRLGGPLGVAIAAIVLLVAGVLSVFTLRALAGNSRRLRG